MNFKKNNRQRQSLQVSLLGSEGHELPTGVHYQTSKLCSESYDVDILQMVQIHKESGAMRKIRREKAGVWRFEQKGNRWCPFPPEVSSELERVCLSLDKAGGSYAGLDIGTDSVSSLAVFDSEAAFSSLDRSLASVGLRPEDLAAARELLFSAAESATSIEVDRLAALLLAFASIHGMRCDIGCARRAGLVVGSMRFLQAVFSTSPELCLIGKDVFDKKYPKLSLQDEGTKNCIRCLLARGMMLGNRNFVPKGKLLRKVEADAEAAWVRRYLKSMIVVCPQLPQLATDRICGFFGLDDPFHTLTVTQLSVD